MYVCVGCMLEWGVSGGGVSVGWVGDGVVGVEVCMYIKCTDRVAVS